MSERAYTLEDLLRVMERLRDPLDGCPWDLRQDFASIVPSTLEECYELAAAIEKRDFPHVAEELGDVLFQVVFYAQMGRERGLFSFPEIVSALVDKLVRRHPHVFADGRIEGVVPGEFSIDEVKESWESIKQRERADRQQSGLLDDIPLALPALPRAQKVQKRAARVRFDWQGSGGVLDKLVEEVSELTQAIEAGRPGDVQEELGDILFTCVNLARHLSLDAEAALRLATDKFERRFRVMEDIAGERGESLGELNEQQLEDLWQQSKSVETLRRDL